MWLLFEVGLIGSRFLGQPKSKIDNDVDDDPVEPSGSPSVATITNEVTEDDRKDDETDEFDLYAPVITDETDSPIIEELDKPEPPEGENSNGGPPKPPLA